MLDFNDIKTIEELLRAEIIAVGENLQHGQRNTSYRAKTHALDVITEHDLKAERAIRRFLKKRFPHVPVVGEEEGGDDSASEYWLIDPLDGTLHFVRGTPFSMIMLALIQNAKPVFCVLYNFATKEYFHAYKGQGAYLNGELLNVSQRLADEAVILTEINMVPAGNKDLYHQLAIKYKLMNLVCAGYEFVMVAQGRAEGRVAIDPYGKKYDFAPGALLVQEAGGIARNLQGAEYSVNDTALIVAASNDIYQSLLDTVRNTRKDLI